MTPKRGDQVQRFDGGRPAPGPHALTGMWRRRWVRLILWALIAFGAFQITGAVLHRPWFFNVTIGLTFVICFPLMHILTTSGSPRRGRREHSPPDPAEPDKLS